jgi:hypothetical protein
VVIAKGRDEMAVQEITPPSSGWWATITNSYPELRNLVSYVCGVATVLGVISVKDQATVMDAVTHIGADLGDIAKYLGVIGGIAMPVLARNSATVENLIRSLYKKSPSVTVVAPPPIAAVTPAESTKEVVVVSKVSGQQLTPKG